MTRLANPGLCVVNTHPVANWDGDWSPTSRFYPLHHAQLTALARTVLHLFMRRPGSAPFQLAVLPLRDALSLGLWAWSFVTRHVHWREDRYQVTRDGSVQPVVRI